MCELNLGASVVMEVFFNACFGVRMVHGIDIVCFFRASVCNEDMYSSKGRCETVTADQRL